MNPECEQLDDYLAGDLAVEQAHHFERHLFHCDACRDAMRQQRWMDGLLQSEAKADLEQPTTLLVESIRSSILSRRWRLRFAAGSLAAAAAIFLMVSVFELNQQEVKPAASPENQIVSTGSFQKTFSDAPRTTFVSNGDAITIAIESPAANVTIVQVYPTIETEQRWQLETALQLPLFTSNGG
jgi:predicted anti-sigma-YlaC factor YlaD